MVVFALSLGAGACGDAVDLLPQLLQLVSLDGSHRPLYLALDQPGIGCGRGRLGVWCEGGGGSGGGSGLRHRQRHSTKEVSDSLRAACPMGIEQQVGLCLQGLLLLHLGAQAAVEAGHGGPLTASGTRRIPPYLPPRRQWVHRGMRGEAGEPCELALRLLASLPRVGHSLRSLRLSVLHHGGKDVELGNLRFQAGHEPVNHLNGLGQSCIVIDVCALPQNLLRIGFRGCCFEQFIWREQHRWNRPTCGQHTTSSVWVMRRSGFALAQRCWPSGCGARACSCRGVCCSMLFGQS
jgi:hypothetical protein